MNRKILFKRIVLGVAIGFWATGIGYGLHALYDHENKPGLVASAPAHLPEAAFLELAQDKPRLLMFIHPKCPCTRASLRELDRLRSEVGQTAMDVTVVVMTGQAPELQFENGLGMQAQAMTGVHIVKDDRGQLAAQMGVWTSGQVLLYDTQGELQFAGGITPSRGHEGDNLGRQTVRDFVLHARQPEQATTPVFGCAIRTAADVLSPISLSLTEEALPCCNP